jgi:hypothetical protein
MLSDSEFGEWCKRNKISAAARKEIENIRNSPPARRVRSGPKNVIGHYNQSSKMSHTIQFESRTVEFPALYTMDHLDKKVLEIWDQPPSFTVRYTAGTGRRTGHIYTSDFFVIEHDSAGWQEWKTEQKLVLLEKQNPNKYFRDDNGNWRFPPGEEYAAQFGFYFKVCSSKHINWILIRNYKVLRPFFEAADE